MSEDDFDAVAVCDRLKAMPDLQIEMRADQLFTLIAMIQLASRHPGTRGSSAAEEVIAIARDLQEKVFGPEAELDRLLERGWHEVFDVPTQRVNLAEECKRPEPEEGD
jgi:hypothetical protein